MEEAEEGEEEIGAEEEGKRAEGERCPVSSWPCNTLDTASRDGESLHSSFAGLLILTTT